MKGCRFNNWDNRYTSLSNFFNDKFNISSTVDLDIIDSYKFDWSNLPADASILTRPKTIKECAIILKTCFKCKIPLTVSAGRTNLTGSATPQGGIIISINNLNKIKTIDVNNKEITCSELRSQLEGLLGEQKLLSFDEEKELDCNLWR